MVLVADPASKKWIWCAMSAGYMAGEVLLGSRISWKERFIEGFGDVQTLLTNQTCGLIAGLRVSIGRETHLLKQRRSVR